MFFLFYFSAKGTLSEDTIRMFLRQLGKSHFKLQKENITLLRQVESEGGTRLKQVRTVIHISFLIYLPYCPHISTTQYAFSCQLKVAYCTVGLYKFVLEKFLKLNSGV